MYRATKQDKVARRPLFPFPDRISAQVFPTTTSHGSWRMKDDMNQDHAPRQNRFLRPESDDSSHQASNCTDRTPPCTVFYKKRSTKSLTVRKGYHIVDKELDQPTSQPHRLQLNASQNRFIIERSNYKRNLRYQCPVFYGSRGAQRWIDRSRVEKQMCQNLAYQFQSQTRVHLQVVNQGSPATTVDPAEDMHKQYWVNFYRLRIATHQVYFNMAPGNPMYHQAGGAYHTPTQLPNLPGNFQNASPEIDPILNHISVQDDESLAVFIDCLQDIPYDTATIFLDAEGMNHGFNGTLSTIQVTFAYGTDTSWIIDILALGTKAFTTKGSKSRSFADILTDCRIPCIWFDIRHDSGALAGQFNIEIGCPIDLQLMVQAAFNTDSPRLWSLDHSILRLLCLSPDKFAEWHGCKLDGQAYLDIQFVRWLQRPLPEVLIHYAAGDTVYLPQLYWICLQRLKRDPELMRLIVELSSERVRATQTAAFRSSGPYAPGEFLELVIERWEKSGGPANYNYMNYS